MFHENKNTDVTTDMVYIPINLSILHKLQIWLYPFLILIATRLGFLLVGYLAPQLFSARPAEGTWRVAGTPMWLEDVGSLG